jgi:hypothetical protein
MNHSRLRKKRRPPGISDWLVLGVLFVYFGGCALLGVNLLTAFFVGILLVPLALMLLIVSISGIAQGFR